MEAKTKKRPSLFYRIFFGGIAVFLLVLIIFIIWLNGFLAEYESAQPIHLAERVMQDYFGDPSLSRVTSEYGEIAEADKASLAEYFASVYKNGFSFNSTAAGVDATAKKYTVSCDGKKVGTFTLDTNGQKTKRGFDVYALTDIDLKIPKKHTYTIEAPSDYSVTFNGAPLGASDASETGIETESCSHMYGDAVGITYTRYTVPSYSDNPEISVITPRGASAELKTDSETGYLRADIVYDEVIPDELKAHVIEAIKTYAVYLQDDSAFTPVARYFDPESELYESIRTVDTWCVITHDSWSFADESVTEYRTYGDGVVSCRISLTHILHMAYHDDYKDYIDMTVYMRKAGNTYLIYDTFKH